MAYTNFQNCTQQEYTEIIYSGEANNKLKVLFNGVDYTTINVKGEKLTVTSRILSNGENRFSLDNFVSKEAELIINDIDLEDIVEPINISIGTLVDEENDTYEYVPIGVFKLDSTPTTDSGKTTIKLRDYSVNFDIPYSAEEVINANGGSATMLQILQDICTKCNVTLGTQSFINDDTEVSVWDNSINARVYVMYIAEKAGCIATMSRDGELIFVDLNSLTPVEIDPLLMEKYEEGENIEISRVVYEDAIRKFEYGEDTNATLYINSANPYITDTTEIENVYNAINGLEMCSMNISKMMGNPTIDPWDILTFTYNEKTYKFLGQNTLTYTKNIMQSFDTQIGTQAKTQENVTINSDDSKFRRVFTRIDQAEGNIEMNTSQITSVQTDLEENHYSKEQTDILIQNAERGLTNTFSTSGGNNIFRNTGLWFKNTDSQTSALNPYEFWYGIVERDKEEKASNMNCLKLQNDTLYQEQTVPNGTYTVSFKYKKLIEASNVKCVINDTEYSLTELTDTDFAQTIEVNSRLINVKFISDMNNACEIYDLMVNAGEVKLAYTQNQNETTTNTVNISKGITITSTDVRTTFKADADGTRIFNNNDLSNPISKFTDTGIETNRINASEGEIADMLIKKVNNHVWIRKL